MVESSLPLHTIDLIRKKRDGAALAPREISYLVTGAAHSTILREQLSAWLMAAFLRGLTLDEIRALTVAMRDSGERFDPSRLGMAAVDKPTPPAAWATETNLLVAPHGGHACRRRRAHDQRPRLLGHTGGTLDKKLESIPGYLPNRAPPWPNSNPSFKRAALRSSARH